MSRIGKEDEEIIIVEPEPVPDQAPVREPSPQPMPAPVPAEPRRVPA